MNTHADAKEVLKGLPAITLLTDGLDLYAQRALKGKFVVTADGKFLARLFPREEWDGSKYFHFQIVEECGVEDGTKEEVMDLMAGGGKMELELMDDYAECRLYGVSTTYGPYNVSDIDIAKLEQAIEACFHLGMMPVVVIPDFKS
jgi:hypothetical protein